MKKIIFTLLVIASSMSLQAQTARVMAIHNSADPAVDTVDVFIWANNAVFTKVENLGFRASTGFVSVPASTNIRVAFAGKNSTTISDTLVGFGFNLTPNATYVLLAEGHVGTGFNPQQPFNLQVVAPASERNTSGGDSTTFVVVHGSTDAPAVDIALRQGNNDLAYLSNLPYGTNSGYLKVKENNYFIDVIPSGSDEALVTYSAPLKSLNLGDSALVAFASGFLNPLGNKNGKAFGVFVALSNGTVVALPVQSTFRLQAFHNCADTVAKKVDVWLMNKTTNTNTRLIPNFEFRKATQFIDAPANQDIAVAVTLPGAPLSDTVYVESIGKVAGGNTYVLVASGVLDESKFDANPSNNPIAFELLGLNGIEKSPEAGKVALQVFHGSTDAPAVDINARGVGTLFGDIEYGYAGDDYLMVNPNTYTIDVAAAGSSTAVVTYTAPLTGFADSALVIFASGFLSPNIPTGKDQGPGFALVAVTSGGQTIVLPISTGLAKTSAGALGVNIYPNPAKDIVTFNSFETNYNTKITISDLSGKTLLEKEWIGNEYTMNIEELETGIYFVQLNSPKGVAYQKLVIE